MKIINTNTLNDKEYKLVKELEALCQTHDSLSGSLFLSPELNEDEEFPCFLLLYEGKVLSAFLSIFMPYEGEAQISVCTRPDRRHQGLCTLLLKEAAELLSEYEIYDMIFLTEPNASECINLLDKFGSELLNSEFLMTYNSDEPFTSRMTDERFELIPAIAENIDVHIDIHHRAFDMEYGDSEGFIHALFNDENTKAYSLFDKTDSTIVGSCYMDMNAADSNIILGVCIDPELQGQGLGRLMMEQLIEKYALLYKKPLSLEVSGDNISAKKLYEGLNFKVTSQFDYLTIECQHIYL